MRKDCTNCLYEFTCSWESAGRKGYCDRWKIDIEEEEDTMRKLTEKDDQGNWRLKGVPWLNLREGKVITKETDEKLYGALFKLMQYEDTDLSPEKIYELNDLYLEKCQELNQRNWIPVWDRLPDSSCYVLVCFENYPLPSVVLYKKDKDDGMFVNIDDDFNVESYGLRINAWMPLPDPFIRL